MALNPDLIEKAEATPDTVITMVDGHKLVVAEPVPEVVTRIRLWRASVAAEAFAMSNPSECEHPTAHEGVAAGCAGPPMARVLRMPAREE
jgi:flagellar protein FlbD